MTPASAYGHAARMARPALSSVAVVAMAGACAIVANGQHEGRTIALGMLAVLVFLVVFLHPGLAAVGIVLTLAFVPSYFLTSHGAMPGQPPALLAAVAAPALALRRSALRVHTGLTAIDVLVAVLAASMLVAVSDGTRDLREFEQASILWFFPYTFARLFTTAPTSRQMLVRMLALSAVALLPFVLAETIGNYNFFARTFSGGTGSATWAPEAFRSGHARAEASFGHPIALSMFVAFAFLVCLACWATSRSPRARFWWATAALVTATEQVLTFSRTGWTIMALGVVVLALRRRPGFAATRVRRLVAIGALAATIAPVALPGDYLSAVPFIGTPDAEVAQSGEYRAQLLDVAFEPGRLHAWGSKTSTFFGAIVGGYGSIDNEYLALSDRWGYVPGALLLLLGLCLIAETLRRPALAFTDLVLVASSIGMFIAIGSVAFITQQQVLFWLLLGAASAAFASGPAQPLRDDG